MSRRDRPGRAVRSGRGRDRAVSTTVGYALTLTLATLVVTGFLLASGGFVEGQREGAVRDELRVVGQQVATDVAAVDRLSRTRDDVGNVSVERDLPDRVTGLSYAVEVNPGSPNELVLKTFDPRIIVRVRVSTDTTLADTSFDGGRARINYNATSDTVNVTRT